MNDWYRTLVRPPLTPPDWIFGPVWTVLYAMIAVSIFLYLRAPRPAGGRLLLAVLAAHLAANFIWTWLFFGLRSPFWALVDIVFLDLSLIWLIAAFWPVSRPAALLLVPYLAWVGFATYLNVMFWKLN